MSPAKLMANPLVQKLTKDKDKPKSPKLRGSKQSTPHGSRRSSRGQRLPKPETPLDQKLPQQHWPLKEDQLWSTELLAEYVHKSGSNSMRADPDMARHTFPKKSDTRRSLLDIARGGEAGDDPRLPAHINRLHDIELRIKTQQQKAISDAEKKLVNDEHQLRHRIERRLNEVEMKLHIALSEDRQRWQKKANMMTIRDGYHKSRAKMKSTFNPKPPRQLTDPMMSATSVYGRQAYSTGGARDNSTAH